MNKPEDFTDYKYAAEDGWIEWNGGGSPVPPDQRVDYRDRDRQNGYFTAFAGDLNWTLRGSYADIVAYRLNTPAEPALSPLTPEAFDRVLVEYRRWMPGQSGVIGKETFFVCREKDDGEVEWLARHPTAEAMRDDLDKRTIEAVLRAALNP